MSHRPWLTFVLLLPAVGCLHPPLAAMLQYDRSLVDSQQILRFLTCQWAHWSLDHFVWDAVVFAILGLLIESRSRGALVGVVGLAAVAVPIGVHFLCPNLTHFRGLSGIDSAMFAFVLSSVCLDAIQKRHRGGVLLCAVAWTVIIGKTLVEMAWGQPIFANADVFVVVPVAHAIGFVCGAVAGVGVAVQMRPATGVGDGSRRRDDSRPTHCTVASSPVDRSRRN